MKQSRTYLHSAEDLSLILNIQNDSGKKQKNTRSPGKATFDDFFEESLKNDKNLLSYIVETDAKQEKSINKSGSRITKEKDSFGNSRETRRLDRLRIPAQGVNRPNSIAKCRRSSSK